jgi:uncharacterized protein YcaQ
LDEKVNDGTLEKVTIEGVKDQYYILQRNVDRLDSQNIDSSEDPVKILTPFDNIIRERHFPEKLWGFDYKIECYVPAPKRIYGYFVLPILDGASLAGRMDVKVHRKDGVLEIKSLFLEEKPLHSPHGLERLRKGVSNFADFHSCERITIGKVRQRGMTKKVRSLFG